MVVARGPDGFDEVMAADDASEWHVVTGKRSSSRRSSGGGSTPQSRAPKAMRALGGARVTAGKARRSHHV